MWFQTVDNNFHILFYPCSTSGEFNSEDFLGNKLPVLCHSTQYNRSVSLIGILWWWIDIHFSSNMANEDFFPAGCHTRKQCWQLISYVNSDLFELSSANGDDKFHQNLCGDGSIVAGSGGGLLSTHFDHPLSKETKRKSERDRFSQVSELMKVFYLE